MGAVAAQWCVDDHRLRLSRHVLYKGGDSLLICPLVLCRSLLRQQLLQHLLRHILLRWLLQLWPSLVLGGPLVVLHGQLDYRSCAHLQGPQETHLQIHSRHWQGAWGNLNRVARTHSQWLHRNWARRRRVAHDRPMNDQDTRGMTPIIKSSHFEFMY
jgi:hypothetical protein